MQAIVWLALLAILAAVAYGAWRMRQRWIERRRASEARLASFVAQTMPPAAPAPPVRDPTVVLQRLLFEAATKAGEAGEAVLSIQLYARLLSRFPDTAFANQARAAVETQKKKLAKGKG